MAFDPNIALQVQPVQIQNPLTMYAQAAALQGVQRQNQLYDLAIADKQRGDAQAQALNDAFKAPGALNADGTLNASGIVGNVAASGHGAAVPALAKSLAETQSAQLAQQKASIDGSLQKLGAIGQVLNGVTDQGSYDLARQWAATHLGPDSVASMPPVYDPTLADGRALAEHAARTPGIRVVGVATYEGTLGGDTPEESAARVVAFAENLGEIVGRLEEAQLVPADCTVSIGGSAYFDAAVDGLISAGIAAHRILLRSGAYLTHDDGFYSRLTPLARGNAAAPALRPAITVWAPVLSIPEPGLAIVLCGRRDVGFDQGMPVVHGSRGRDGSDPRPFSGTITQLADQHAFIQFDPSGDAPRVGDLVEVGISHPCTTLDRWGLVPLVDDEARIVDLIRMHFA